MRKLLVFIWRWFMSQKLRQKKIKISPSSHFNFKTIFEGYNYLARNANVGGTFLGKYSYVGYGSSITDSKIGRFCSIGVNVVIISDTHPTSLFVSTCPSFYSIHRQNGHSFVKKNKFEEYLNVDGFRVVIGNDVWIGSYSLIKGGITIGDGAIIAMGSVVTKDVPAYAIVGGVPAKIIRYRFTEEQIERLEYLQWWNQSDDWLEAYADDFSDIEQFLNKIKK